MTRIFCPASATTGEVQFAFDESGKPVGIQGPGGTIIPLGGVQLTYDASGNVLGIQGAGGTYGVNLRPVLVTNTDNTATINDAINAVALQGGGIVELPAGSFSAAGIQMKSGVWLRGQGMGVTTLTLPSNTYTGPATSFPPDLSNVIFAKASGSDLREFKITALTIDANRANQVEPNGFDNGLNCICVRGSGDANNYVTRNFVIEDVETKSAIWHGIALYDGVRDFTLNRIHSWDNGYRPIHCHSKDTGVTNARYRITNCLAHNNGVSTGQNMQTAGYVNSGIFVVLTNTVEAIVTGNTIYDEVGPGLDIGGVDGIGSVLGAKHSIFTANTVTNCGIGIKVGGGADSAIIANNIIRNCTTAGRPVSAALTGNGIDFNTGATLGASNIKVQGNTITGCYGWGISTANAANKWKNLSIIGNHVIGNSTGSGAISYGGIALNQCDTAIVTGNIVKYNCNAGGADRQFYATSTTNSVITGNVFDCAFKSDGVTAFGAYPASELMSTCSGLVYTNNYNYRNGSGNGYNFAAASSVHFNNTGDKTNSASLSATGSGPRFNHDITNGASSAALGANCPAVTATAPYAWTKVTTMDGSVGYMPVWK